MARKGEYFVREVEEWYINAICDEESLAVEFAFPGQPSSSSCSLRPAAAAATKALAARILWRDRMDVPSQCTIVRTGR
jgi:hypothetical protein